MVRSGSVMLPGDKDYRVLQRVARVHEGVGLLMVRPTKHREIRRQLAAKAPIREVVVLQLSLASADDALLRSSGKSVARLGGLPPLGGDVLLVALESKTIEVVVSECPLARQVDGWDTDVWANVKRHLVQPWVCLSLRDVTHVISKLSQVRVEPVGSVSLGVETFRFRWFPHAHILLGAPIACNQEGS